MSLEYPLTGRGPRKQYGTKSSQTAHPSIKPDILPVRFSCSKVFKKSEIDTRPEEHQRREVPDSKTLSDCIESVDLGSNDLVYQRPQARVHQDLVAAIVIQLDVESNPRSPSSNSITRVPRIAVQPLSYKSDQTDIGSIERVERAKSWLTYSYCGVTFRIPIGCPFISAFGDNLSSQFSETFPGVCNPQPLNMTVVMVYYSRCIKLYIAT